MLLLHWLFSRVWAANIVRRLCSDSIHVTALYKLSFIIIIVPISTFCSSCEVTRAIIGHIIGVCLCV